MGFGRPVADSLTEALRRKGLPVCATGGGPVFQLHFQEHAPHNYRETLAHDARLYSDFVLALLDEGILALPDGRWYLSAIHSEVDIDRTLDAVKRL